MKKITQGSMMATITGCLLASMSLSAQDIGPDLMSGGFTSNHSNQKTTEKPATQQVALKAGVGTTFPVDIPDNDPVGVDILIEATNFVGNIESVTLEIEMEHTWVGDLTATLTAPNGIARLVLFSGIGKNRENLLNGDSSVFEGTYIFNDQSSNDLWSEASSTGVGVVIQNGSYRTSTSGNPDNLFGGCTTRLNGAFGGLTPQQANGTWTLNIKDEANSDTGQVLNVGLLVDEQLVPDDLIFSSSFQFEDQFIEFRFPQASNVLGECSKAQFDYTGTGFSDYVHSYELSDEMVVQIKQNNGDSVGDLVIIGDLPAPSSLNPQITSGADFDGDGIQDLVFKVDTSNSFVERYLVRRSSRPNDLYMSTTFFIDGDPQFGDYEGDGLDDLGIFFYDDLIGNATLLIKESSTENLRELIIGTAAADDNLYQVAGGFDHNGDRIADVSVYIAGMNPQDNKIVKVFDGDDGTLLTDSVTGFYNPVVRQLPGHFLAPNSAGVSTVAFDIFNAYIFQVRSENLSSLVRDRSLLAFADFVPITGDYDGDGLDDFGLWIPNEKRFRILPSSSADPLNNLIEVTDADYLSTDYPVGNSRVR